MTITLGIVLAVLLAVGIGVLIGQRNVSNPADLYSRCAQLPAEDRLANCIALRSALAAEDAAERAFWSNAISFATFVGSIAAFVGLIITIRQSRGAIALAASANRISEEHGQAQTRAYLVITAFKARIDQSGGVVACIEVYNSGQSPARNVTWGYAAHVAIHSEGGCSFDGCVGPGTTISQSYWTQTIGADQSWQAVPWHGPRSDELRQNAIEAEMIILTAQVVVRYEDVFGNSHEEWACFAGRVSCNADPSRYRNVEQAHIGAYDELVARRAEHLAD